jgi:hypothetical protein
LSLWYLQVFPNAVSGVDKKTKKKPNKNNKGQAPVKKTIVITQKTKYWTRGVSQKAVFSLCAYTSYSFNVFILECDILLNWSTQIAAI